MATILDFPRREDVSRAQARGRDQATAPAEIVLFPGVRYERTQVPDQAREEMQSTRRRRRSVKRDTLDILD